MSSCASLPREIGVQIGRDVLQSAILSNVLEQPAQCVCRGGVLADVEGGIALQKRQASVAAPDDQSGSLLADCALYDRCIASQMIDQVDNDIAVLAISAEFVSTPAMSLVPLATALRLAAALGRRRPGLRGALGAVSSLKLDIQESLFSSRSIPR